jgi:hypothetical protein
MTYSLIIIFDNILSIDIKNIRSVAPILNKLQRQCNEENSGNGRGGSVSKLSWVTLDRYAT